MRQLYIQIIMESIEYYDEMAQTHLRRSPKHVLLLHEMDLSVLFIGDLVDALRDKGWTIISPADAYHDEISQYQAERLLRYNPGRMGGGIALNKGQEKGLWHHTLDEAYLGKRFKDVVLQPK
ncbi:hypothetical protein [Shewanella surugensis]|uniref:Uncharacterized protein n=1 Tax=Shewanella surugensis TaxID=212020 RepID=A0ABT0LJA1_9GAMM|nr:hypothetical protein [Shewanella surugensis]MCL1127745.1 hypothetical protein [Shewanella surugensis]